MVAEAMRKMEQKFSEKTHKNGPIILCKKNTVSNTWRTVVGSLSILFQGFPGLNNQIVATIVNKFFQHTAQHIRQW